MGKRLARNGVVIFVLFSETFMPKIYNLLNSIPTKLLGVPEIRQADSPPPLPSPPASSLNFDLDLIQQ